MNIKLAYVQFVCQILYTLGPSSEVAIITAFLKVVSRAYFRGFETSEKLHPSSFCPKNPNLKANTVNFLTHSRKIDAFTVLHLTCGCGPPGAN